MYLVLTRKYHPRQTVGSLQVLDGVDVLYSCFSLELPFKENRQRISCIIEGVYWCQNHESPKFGTCIWVKNVPLRDGILIHPANYTSELLGCIAPGKEIVKMDDDNLWDVKYSVKAMNELLAILPDEFELVVNRYLRP